MAFHFLQFCACGPTLAFTAPCPICPSETLFPPRFSSYPSESKVEKQNMCEWSWPPQRATTTSNTCCRDWYEPQTTTHLNSSLVCAIWQIRGSHKTHCPGTGHGRRACTTFTLSRLLKWSQLWTKAAKASWLCSELPLHVPLWFWLPCPHSVFKICLISDFNNHLYTFPYLSCFLPFPPGLWTSSLL